MYFKDSGCDCRLCVWTTDITTHTLYDNQWVIVIVENTCLGRQLPVRHHVWWYDSPPHCPDFNPESYQSTSQTVLWSVSSWGYSETTNLSVLGACVCIRAISKTMNIIIIILENYHIFFSDYYHHTDLWISDWEKVDRMYPQIVYKRQKDGIHYKGIKTRWRRAREMWASFCNVSKKAPGARFESTYAWLRTPSEERHTRLADPNHLF